MNRTAQRKQRAARAEALTSLETVYVSAWAADIGDLGSAKLQTYQALEAALGERRRGPIEWVQLTGERAIRFLVDIIPDQSGQLAEHYNGIRLLLLDRGGWLVLALAKAAKNTEGP